MLRSLGIWHQQIDYRKILNLTFKEIRLASVGVLELSHTAHRTGEIVHVAYSEEENENYT